MDMRGTKKSIGSGFAKAVSILVLLAMASGVFILSKECVVRLWDVHALVDTHDVLPWYLLVLFLSCSFLDCFNFTCRRYHALLYSCVFSAVITCVIVLALPFVLVGAQVSKKVMLLNFVLLCLCLAVWLKISRDLFFRFRTPSRTLLVTEGNKELWLIDKINSNNRIFKVCGHVSPKDDNFVETVSSYDAVVIGSIDAEEKRRTIGLCASLEKQVMLRPLYTDLMLINAQTEQFDDLMMIRAGSFGITVAQRAVKRTVDIIFSSIALVVMLPVMLICSLFIFLEDHHSPFYLQERLTRGGRKFNVIKLRTMIPDAEKDSGPVLACVLDERITKTGRFLRKLRLDEWPQVLNILKGDMSIVGPRPEREYFYDKICDVIPEFKHRLSVKAGLTGMAQVHGRYSTDPYEKLMLDLMYIQNYTAMMDVKLVIETVRVLFERDAAGGVSENESDVKKRTSTKAETKPKPQE